MKVKDIIHYFTDSHIEFIMGVHKFIADHDAICEYYFYDIIQIFVEHNIIYIVITKEE